MFKPYCPQCGRVKPEEVTATNCIPCQNAGHWVRLVFNEEDRQHAIGWRKNFFDRHGYSEAERNAIPVWRNLSTIPVEARMTDWTKVGEECPISGDFLLDVRFGDGTVKTGKSSDFDWGNDMNIIECRLAQMAEVDSTQKKIFATLKQQSPGSVLLLQSGDEWITFGPDMDHILDVYPDAVMGKDHVAVPDNKVGCIINALRSKGQWCVLAERVSKAPAGE